MEIRSRLVQPVSSPLSVVGAAARSPPVEAEWCYPVFNDHWDQVQILRWRPTCTKTNLRNHRIPPCSGTGTDESWNPCSPKTILFCLEIREVVRRIFQSTKCLFSRQSHTAFLGLQLRLSPDLTAGIMPLGVSWTHVDARVARNLQFDTFDTGWVNGFPHRSQLPDRIGRPPYSLQIHETSDGGLQT